VVELYECFDTDTHYLGHLTKLKQSGTMEDFISSFEHLDFRTKGMSDAFFRECFISGLKDEIQPMSSWIAPQTWLEATQRAKEAQQLCLPNIKPSFIPRTLNLPTQLLLPLLSRSRN
jgi:hypothetical protein